MQERITRIEELLRALKEKVERLEDRLDRLEGAAGAIPQLPAEAPPSPPSPPLRKETPSGQRPAAAGGAGFVSIMTLTGRTFLVLAGAFLLRTFTDAGILPQNVGVGLGIAYALFWIVSADLSAGRGRGLSAAFHGFGAVLIVYPLLWETTSQLGILNPDTSIALLTLVTAVALFVAGHRRIHTLAWAVTLATLASCVGLLVSKGSIEHLTLPLLLLCAATVWLAYARDWRYMRWLVAVAADLWVLLLVYLATRPPGLPGRFGPVSGPWVQVLALALLFVYLGTFVVLTLARGYEIKSFEFVQSALALLGGFGGAAMVAHHIGSGEKTLGWAALGAAAACYAVAFTFVDRRHGRGRNFFFYAWLALVLNLAGSVLSLPQTLSQFYWIAMGLAAAFLGARFDRITLRAHCVVYFGYLAWSRNLLAAALLAYTGFSLPAWPPITSLALPSLVIVYGLLTSRREKDKGTAPLRIPSLLVLLLLILCGGGWAITEVTGLLAPLLSAPAAQVIVPVRTGVLAMVAVLFALLGPKSRFREMSWLVYPLLLLGMVKILIEDLHRGAPLITFSGFLFYGTALIAAPRLLRNRG